MIEYGPWRHALAMTESGNHALIWGDQGKAAGRFQMHPVFVDRWWPDGFIAEDFMTWDDLFEACLRNFFNSLSPKAPGAITLACWFHEHGGEGPITDREYAARFQGFYGGGL